MKRLPVTQFLKVSGLTALAASTVLLTSTPANAVGDTPAAGVSLVSGIAFQQYCQVALVNVGVGGAGGLTYQIAAEGSAVGTNVLNTSIGCKIYQDGATRYLKNSNFTPGGAAVLSDSWTTYSLSSLKICAQTRAFVSSGATVLGGWSGQNGLPCTF